MSFLSPWFLPALAAVAAPLVLHLLNRRKRRVVRWAAMRFLMATEAQRRKSPLRLKDVILLLLRVAVVAALVLFFARPLLPAQLAPAGSRDVVLVLDTSLSMARLTDTGSVWKESAAKAEKALDSLEAGDFVRILLAREAPQWLTASALEMTPGGKSQAVALLRSAGPGQGSCRLADALSEAVAARPVREGLRRRVVVFSDFQAASVKAEAAAAWTGLRDAAQSAAGGGCVVEAVDSGLPGTPPNLAVLRVDVSREQAAPGESLLFSARVRNAGPVTSGVATIRWIVGEEPSGLSNVMPLKAGAETTVEFRHAAPPEAGTVLVRCELEAPSGDVLAEDNAASVLVETVEAPGVLLVDGSGAADAGVSDTAWIQAALGGGDSGAPGEPTPFRLITVPVARFTAAAIGANRMVVLANPPLLDESVISALENFVRDGGGLWLLPGDRTEDAGQVFSQAFFGKGAGLSPLRWTVAEGEARDADHAVKLLVPAVAHPVTRLLQDPRRSDFSSVRVRRWFRFESPAPPETQVLLSTEGGAPFLAEGRFGEGRVLVQAAPFNLAWSDWPRHHAFVVLLHEGLWRLAASGEVRRNLAVGETLSWPVPAWIKEDPLPLRKPDGQYGSARREGQGRAAVSSDTLEPGLYTVEAKGAGASAAGTQFWVRRGEEESDLRPVSEEERQRIERAGGLQFTPVPLTRTQTGETVESRRPAGPLLAAAGVVLLCLESLAAAVLLWKRHQSGALEAAETATAAGGAG